MSDLLPFTLPWCLIHPSMPWYPHHSAFFHHYTLFIPFYPIICHSFALHSPLYPFTFFPPITTAKSLSFPPLQCLFTYTCCFMRRAIHLSAPWSIAFILTSPHINTLAVSCRQPLQIPIYSLGIFRSLALHYSQCPIKIPPRHDSPSMIPQPLLYLIQLNKSQLSV